MTLEKLYKMVNEYEGFSCKPKQQKYKVGFIFDEEKSVRWNREEVERQNQKHDDEVKALNNTKNHLYNRLVAGIKTYIIEQTKVSKEKADKIYAYLYCEYHSYGLTECLNHLDDLLELFV